MPVLQAPVRPVMVCLRLVQVLVHCDRQCKPQSVRLAVPGPPECPNDPPHLAVVQGLLCAVPRLVPGTSPR